MRLESFAIAAIVVTMLAPAATAQSLSVEPGEWKSSHTFTGTMEANGMSMDLPGQTNTSTQCISAEDAAFKPEQMSGDECTPSNIQQSGNTISFDINCDQGGASTQGTMEATAADNGRSVTGTMTMKGSQPGAGSLDMTGEFTGERVGACS